MEKNNKGLMVLVIILSLLVVGLGGYIIYDKVINVEEDNNKVVDNGNENEEDNNNEQYDELFYDNLSYWGNEEDENYNNYNNFLALQHIKRIIDLNAYNLFDRLIKDGLSEDIKLSMALSGSDIISNDKFTCDEYFDISETAEGYQETGEYRPSEDVMYMCDIMRKASTVSYDYDFVNAVYKKLFGYAENAPKRIEYCDNTKCAYSQKKNSYVELQIQATGLIPEEYCYEIKKVLENQNELRITITYLEYFYGLDYNYHYYINDKSYIINNEEDIKKAYYDNEKILPSLTFVFAKENQHYILKSVE